MKHLRAILPFCLFQIKDIPNAQLVVFDQCGHVPQVEEAAEFNAAVLKFLAGAVHGSGN